MINKFVHQLSLTQMLSDTLWELHCAGHFGYESYREQFELTEPVEKIQSALRAAKTSLDWWRALTTELRVKHASLNICVLRQLGALLRALESLPADEPIASFATSDDPIAVTLCGELGAIACLVAPGLDAGPAGVLGEAAAAMAHAWRQTAGIMLVPPSEGFKDAMAKVQLQRLALALDAALEVIPRRVRPASRDLIAAAGRNVASRAHEQDVTSSPLEDGAFEHGRLPSGIHLVCAEADASALQLLLSACVHHGALPERESALLCWEGGDLEEVALVGFEPWNTGETLSHDLLTDLLSRPPWHSAYLLHPPVGWCRSVFLWRGCAALCPRRGRCPQARGAA